MLFVVVGTTLDGSCRWPIRWIVAPQRLEQPAHSWLTTTASALFWTPVFDDATTAKGTSVRIRVITPPLSVGLIDRSIDWCDVLTASFVTVLFELFSVLGTAFD